MNFSQSSIRRQAIRIACFGLIGLCAVVSWNGMAENKAPSAQPSAAQIDLCPRPAVGSAVPEPADVRSSHGVLKLDLTIRNVLEKDGSVRYCYMTPSGAESPTLRVHPGDRVELRLKNDLKDIEPDAKANGPIYGPICSATAKPHKVSNPCDSGVMTATSTNLHFHGMTMSPVCHQDDVLKTSIQPSDPVFEYNFVVPKDEPPGLYWYHPHVHGFSSVQVEGGASGALIVEGIERAMPEVAGLPERVLVIRDQDLLNPNAPPNKSEPPQLTKSQVDSDGDAQNNGTGFGKPSKDLSVNFVTVPYPNYEPATIRIKPGQKQLWRVLNSSSVTYLNLALLYQRKPQSIGIVAIDGVPEQKDGKGVIPWVDHIGIPPGSRVEFIMNGPPAGETGLLVTRWVDTGPAGENDPNRALALIKADPQAPELASTLPTAHTPLPAAKLTPLRDVKPVRTRKLFFTEVQSNPNDPNSPTDFYITVEGQKPKLFDPHNGMPNITVHQGDVEDWIIENRSPELHAFHIHQIHFLVMEVDGHPVDEPFLRDTVNVPYYKSTELSYPSVRLRMDFRDPHTVGTFVYHCHLLEHEDGGMMGIVRVLPRGKK
ncbi:multicopper oxidase family protein [Trinickia dinghuensis]|uniref:Copper oxidase n=1 Tax=Trinickia dinghuensis TaxID=2291023 RepID=A0A3D8K3L4_9BURK|nr:multicopper oxidase domain-containing protein [Trinickia dinghuensis]RDU99760.1 copper oxidase [Trinickia dinghuensis]